jgi:MerR family copper efflux transcriptional regulator
MSKGQLKLMTIGQLAKSAGVGVDTIRFYERRALLPEPARTASGYRLYADDSIARLQFIRRAKRLGFSLDEIQILLGFQESGGHKAEVRELTVHKLEQIDTKISDLMRIREALDQLASECTGDGTLEGCPIIEALTNDVS